MAAAHASLGLGCAQHACSIPLRRPPAHARGASTADVSGTPPQRHRAHHQPPQRPSVAAMASPGAPAPAAGAIRREPSAAVLAALRGADAFCFDVDSTFCQDESIDELAAFLGVGDRVAALTAAAMGGAVPFQDALAQRLDVMRPSASDVANFLASHPHLVTPGIPELLAALAARGQHVFLVSGGFRQIIHPLAEALGIPVDHVFANSLLFRPDGAYAGFDPGEFTSRSGGKCEAVRHLKARWGLGGVVMVGDGATDAEARAPGGADVFVGYGGVVFRQGVAERADWYVEDVGAITRALLTV